MIIGKGIPGTFRHNHLPVGTEDICTIIGWSRSYFRIEITAYENRIKVENAPVGSILEIYSVVGIKVKEIEVKQSTAEYVVDIAKGYYIIRIGDTVRKVAIR